MSTQVEIKRNKNQLPIPCINGVSLHSVYDPIKESEQQIEKFVANLNGKTNVLVLGLGFAYHIESLINYYVGQNINFNIVVIEPNIEVVNLFQKERKVALKNTTIICHNHAKTYYQDSALVNFLFLKPAVLKHETSFSINASFFKDFLSFKGEKNISNYIGDLTPSLQNYFQQSKLNSNQTISEYSTQIKSVGQIENQNDFLILALDELIRTTKYVQQGR